MALGFRSLLNCLSEDVSFPSILVVFPSGSVVKDLPVMQEAQVQSLGKEDPLEEAWQPTPVFLPGESHGQGKPGGLQSMGLQRV